MQSVRTNDTMQTLKRLLSCLYRYPGQLTFIVISGFATAITSLMAPWLIGSAIDQLLGEGLVQWDALARISILLAIVYLLNAFTHWLSYNLTQRISNLVVSDLR